MADRGDDAMADRDDDALAIRGAGQDSRRGTPNKPSKRSHENVENASPRALFAPGGDAPGGDAPADRDAVQQAVDEYIARAESCVLVTATQEELDRVPACVEGAVVVRDAASGAPCLDIRGALDKLGLWGSASSQVKEGVPRIFTALEVADVNALFARGQESWRAAARVEEERAVERTRDFGRAAAAFVEHSTEELRAKAARCKERAHLLVPAQEPVFDTPEEAMAKAFESSGDDEDDDEAGAQGAGGGL